MNDDACVLTHDQRTPALDGLLLCRKHRHSLDDLTTEIGALIIDSCRIIDGGAPSEATPKTRRVKQPEAPAPGDLAIMALYDSRTLTVRLPGDQSTPMVPVLHVIASWLLLVAEERPLTTPLPTSVLAQLDLLSRHHEWLAAHPAVDDYHLEMTELRTHLRGAVRDHTHKRVTTCDLPTDDGQHPAVIIRRNRALRIVLICGGAVLVRNGDDVWRCNRCGGTWLTDQQKARFGVRGAA